MSTTVTSTNSSHVRDVAVAAARGDEVLKLHLFVTFAVRQWIGIRFQIDGTAELALRYSPLEQGWIRLLAARFKLVFDKAIDRPYAQTPYYYYYSGREGLFNTPTTNRTTPSKLVDIRFFYPDSWDTAKAPRATHLYNDYDYYYADDELPNNQSHLQGNQHGKFDQQACSTYWSPTDKLLWIILTSCYMLIPKAYYFDYVMNSCLLVDHMK